MRVTSAAGFLLLALLLLLPFAPLLLPAAEAAAAAVPLLLLSRLAAPLLLSVKSAGGDMCSCSSGSSAESLRSIATRVRLTCRSRRSACTGLLTPAAAGAHQF
jgi:hypothetical protein